MLKAPRIAVLVVLLLLLPVAQSAAMAAAPTDEPGHSEPQLVPGTGIAGITGTGSAVLTVTIGGSNPAGSGAATGRPENAAPTGTVTGAHAPSPPDPCFYVPRSSAEATAAGYDASKGTLSTAKCPVQSNQPGLPDGVRYVTHQVWTLNGAAPAPPPPPDPAELAQSVASQLTVPAPVLHVGSPQERVAVKVPVWLWADDQPALTASVSAGGLTVTAEAVLTSMDWSMGEPVGDPDEGGSGRVASFTCAGAGVAPPVGVGASVVPACGYTFIWRSDAARTGGVGAWAVGAVAHWTMTWRATNGAQGTIALQAAATTQVTVGEWRVALVDGGGTR